MIGRARFEYITQLPSHQPPEAFGIMDCSRALLLTVACLALSCASGRDLKVIRLECCEGGLSLQTPGGVSVDVDGSGVSVQAPGVSTTVTEDRVVVDTSFVSVDTKDKVKVKVKSGQVMYFSSDDNGVMKLTVGEDGETVVLYVDDAVEGTVEKHYVWVDYSNPSGLIVVEVGEGAKIVDAVVVEGGTGHVKVGEDGRVAIVDLSGKEIDVVVGGATNREDDGSSEENDVKVDISFVDGISTLVWVQGTDIVETSVDNY